MILRAATPRAWVEAAVQRVPELLADHANCEKKAASTALALLFAYPDDAPLCEAMSRLAREELRHFEQVQRLSARLRLPFLRLSPGRYAAGLRREIAHQEPQRRCDLLLTGALIEARSCERFELLAPRLPAPVAQLYEGLAESERRHGERYLELARERGCDWSGRLERLAAVEAGLATQPDDEFRFHSGPPLA